MTLVVVAFVVVAAVNFFDSFILLDAPLCGVVVVFSGCVKKSSLVEIIYFGQQGRHGCDKIASNVSMLRVVHIIRAHHHIDYLNRVLACTV